MGDQLLNNPSTLGAVGTVHLIPNSKKFPQKNFFWKIFAVFADFGRISPHGHPYAFLAKNCDFGRKKISTDYKGGG